MTESVKSITQHHEPLRIFIAAESADETGKMARTFCDASDIVVTGSATHAADVDAAFARDCPAGGKSGVSAVPVQNIPR